MLAHNAKVYVAGRDKAKADKAFAELKGISKNSNEPIFLKLDLGNLASVKASAQEFMRYASLNNPRSLLLNAHDDIP